MSGLLRFLALLAAVGLALSVTAHALTFVAPERAATSGGFWLLHLGLFVVFVPAVLSLRKLGPKPALKAVFGPAPRWMFALVATAFVYAFVNFILEMVLSGGGVPTERGDGTFAMMSHGTLIRELSRPEYMLAKARVMRGFSGHWMLFYSAAMAMLTAAARRRDAER